MGDYFTSQMYGLPKMHITLSTLGFWRMFRPRDISRNHHNEALHRPPIGTIEIATMRDSGKSGVKWWVTRYLRRDSCQTECVFLIGHHRVKLCVGPLAATSTPRSSRGYTPNPRGLGRSTIPTTIPTHRPFAPRIPEHLFVDQFLFTKLIFSMKDHNMPDM